MKECYIVDIDGTLADITHRLKWIEGDKKDWDKFFDECKNDRPIGNMIKLVSVLAQFGSSVILVSGRPERTRELTEEWLSQYGPGHDELYMRKDGDHRQDYQIKQEILMQILDQGYKIIAAIDDRKQVVDMWRSHNILTLQCAEGDY